MRVCRDRMRSSVQNGFLSRAPHRAELSLERLVREGTRRHSEFSLSHLTTFLEQGRARDRIVILRWAVVKPEGVTGL